MTGYVDQPIEVTLTDGTSWIVYYRFLPAAATYARAVGMVADDIKAGRLIPADDLDGVQRRHTQINAAHIVSVHEVSTDG